MVYDVWMHLHYRKVPRQEQVTHCIAIILLSFFILSAIWSFHKFALIALISAIPIMLYDEIAFHKMLSKHERRIHNIAGICFLGFISMWVLSMKQLFN